MAAAESIISWKDSPPVLFAFPTSDSDTTSALGIRSTYSSLVTFLEYRCLHLTPPRTAAASPPDGYAALVDERLRRACEAASTTTSPEAPLRSLLGSPDPRVVFWKLIKLRDSIHRVHLEITSLCGGGGGSPSPADAAFFRPRAVAAYLGLRYITQIADATITPHPDTLLLLLRMYDPLADLFDLSLASFLPILEQLSVERGGSFSARFDGTLLALRTTIKTTLSVLVARISARSSKHAGSTAAGGVDEITRYLLDYIKLLLSHSSLLSMILVGDNPERGMESLKDVVISLISSLDASLHKKSRRQHQQQQQGLQWLFMASNAHHVLKQAESSETMRLLLGHGWILERREQLDGHIARYLAASWEPLLSCFQEAADDDDGDHHAGTSRIPLICFGARATSSSPSPAAAARTMITRFNVEFEETWSIHRAWKVEDGQLRDRMRRAVAGTIVPAYREFLEKRRRRVLPEFVRFSAEEMEERLSELYEG